jgi:hypothetical protein
MVHNLSICESFVLLFVLYGKFSPVMQKVRQNYYYFLNLTYWTGFFFQGIKYW